MTGGEAGPPRAGPRQDGVIVPDSPQRPERSASPNSHAARACAHRSDDTEAGSDEASDVPEPGGAVIRLRIAATGAGTGKLGPAGADSASSTTGNREPPTPKLVTGPRLPPTLSGRSDPLKEPASAGDRPNRTGARLLFLLAKFNPGARRIRRISLFGGGPLDNRYGRVKDSR
jgi:hypothetical protein